MNYQEHIHDTIIEQLKSLDSKWYDEFNKLDRIRRARVLKDIYTNYCHAILNFANNKDPDIHITNIGTLTIKPSRKQFLDLKKSGVEEEEAVKIVKYSYRKLNNKKENEK